ncbi:MAG TPA: terminase [Acidobacteriaceae bacterium]|nr:terminase [Acidobacteriaceae bacterium]
MSEEKCSLEQLLRFGKHFDDPCDELGGEIPSTWLAQRFLKIRDRGGEESFLVPNRVQSEYAKQRRQRNIVVKARQMGLTTWIAGRFFLKTITGRGVLTVQVAHTQDAAESIFRMVQRFWECLPEDMRKGPLKRSRANVRQMVFPELDSEFRVLTAADANAGRGLTVQNMHLSEVSRWPGDAAATLAGMRAALIPTGELVLESTPNGAHGCFYEEWQQAEENGVQRHFFPWWLEPAYVSAAVTDPREDELELMVKHELSYEQIGFRRGLEASYRGLRVQEFAEDAELCFRSTGECCFGMDVIEARLKSVDDAMSRRREGKLQIFLPPQVGREYIVAVDPAGGGSEGDYAAVQVIDRQSGAQCAEVQQRLRPREVARVAVELAREYSTPGEPALIVVERNNHGHGVLAYLTTSEPYENIYGTNGVAGWLTTSSSKPMIIGDLGALLEAQPDLFRSKRLLEECRTFVTHANGRTGATHGAHDDCVMAFAIAQSVRKELLVGGRRSKYVM